MNSSVMDHVSAGHTTMEASHHDMHDMNMTNSDSPEHVGHRLDHSSTSHSAVEHVMKMYFHAGYDEVVLFESWKITSVGGLIGSMIGIFIMACLYEGLKYYREYLFRKTYATIQYSSVAVPTDGGMVKETRKAVQASMLSWIHLFQTCLHIVQVVLSYFLMLIFMTYNVWLCLAVTLGATTGYFIFGWKKSVIVDITEHCH